MSAGYDGGMESIISSCNAVTACENAGSGMGNEIQTSLFNCCNAESECLNITAVDVPDSCSTSSPTSSPSASNPHSKSAKSSKKEKTKSAKSGKSKSAKSGKWAKKRQFMREFGALDDVSQQVDSAAAENVYLMRSRRHSNEFEDEE